MKVLNYKATNVKGLRDINFDLEGKHLFLVGGKTGEGKSSSLDAICMALCGKSAMDDYPAQPIRDGESKATVNVKLSGDRELHDDEGFEVQLSLHKRRSGEIAETLRVLDSAGEESPESRKTLQRLFEYNGFDPLAFSRRKRAEQADIIRKMAGIDTSEIEAERKRIYDERTSKGREGKSLLGKYEAMESFADAPKEPVSVADLMEELGEAEKANALIVGWERQASDSESEIQKGDRRIKNLEADIERLQAEIAFIREDRTEQEACIKAARDSLSGCEKVDEQAIRDRISDAGEINDKVAANQRKKSAGEELEESRKAYEKMTRKLKSLDKQKQAAIESAEYPIEGLAVDEEGVTLNGTAFEQLSTREKIVASAEIGMALEPKLRLMIIREGGLLDSETLDALDALLKERDFQAIVELVTRSEEDEDRCAVIIEGGEVRGA